MTWESGKLSFDMWGKKAKDKPKEKGRSVCSCRRMIKSPQDKLQALLRRFNACPNANVLLSS